MHVLHIRRILESVGHFTSVAKIRTSFSEEKKHLTDRVWFTRSNNTVYLYWKQPLKLMQPSRCKISNM